MELRIALAGLLLVCLTLLGLVETAFACLSEVAVRSLTAEPHVSPRTKFLRYLIRHRALFFFSLNFGIQTTLLGLGVLAADMLLVAVNEIAAIPLAFLAALTVAVVFRQLIPLLVVQNSPAQFLMRLLPLFEWYFRLSLIVVFPLYRLTRMFQRTPEMSLTPESAAQATQDDTLQALIDVGEEEGIIEESDSELIQSIIEFGDTVVNEVMTLRTDMVCIEASATIREARDLMISSRHSRLPVYREQPENIEGVVYVRDLLSRWNGDPAESPVGDIARPAYFVPDTKSVAELLEEMQKSKTQIAIVIDEFGGVAGLVTIEDILEEIVGEIEDEDNVESPADNDEIVKQSDGSFIVKGSAEIRKVELLFNREFESDDFTTINGLITNELDRVPAAGETFTMRGLQGEIIESDGRVIRKVKLRLAEDLEEDELDKSRAPGFDYKA